MAAESKKSTEKADQRNNLLLCDNIQQMAELIRDDKIGNCETRSASSEF